MSEHNELYYFNLLNNSNIHAYLLTIRRGEGTLGPNGYRIHYGGGLIDRLDVRPKHKVYEGNPPSSAVGAYQFLNSDRKPFWDEVADHFKWNDFLQIHQDIAAVYKIEKDGAIDDVLNGDIISAIDKTKQTWASLPGATYKQPTQQLREALKFYQNHGGVLNAAGRNEMNGSVQATKLNGDPPWKIVQMTNVNAANNRNSISKQDNSSKSVTGIFNAILNGKISDAGSIAETSMAFKNPDWFEVAKLNTMEMASIASQLKNHTTLVDASPSSRMPIEDQKKITYPVTSSDDFKKAQYAPYLLEKSEHHYEVTEHPLITIPHMKEVDERPNFVTNAFFSSLPGSLTDLRKLAIDTNDPTWLASDTIKINGGIQEFNKKYDVPLEPMLSPMRENEQAIKVSNQNTETHRQDAISHDKKNGRTININLNTPMIENFTINIKDRKEAIAGLKREIEEVLMEILNSATVIH